MADQGFNPLDMGNLAQSIVNKMEESEPTPLGSVTKFFGAGLYAIYYTGDFACYHDLAQANRGDSVKEPIYVGKAIPAGGRQGIEIGDNSVTDALFKRVREHAGSVKSAENLNIEDFWVRWLVVEDIWIPLGESAMIRRYRPVWNSFVDGFGNHHPGSGRKDGVVSRWDTVHPGRKWAKLFPPRAESSDAIQQDAAEYIRSRLA